jgi:hypothetical protein
MTTKTTTKTTTLSRPAYPTKKNEQIAARKSLEARGLSREQLAGIVQMLEPINPSDPLVEAAKEMLLESAQVAA